MFARHGRVKVAAQHTSAKSKMLQCFGGSIIRNDATNLLRKEKSRVPVPRAKTVVKDEETFEVPTQKAYLAYTSRNKPWISMNKARKS